MVFGLILTVFNTMIPVLMLIFGMVFARNAPKTINYVYGYRTKRSMLNQDTWEFAQAYFGRLWKRVGAILLPLSILFSLPMLWMKEDDKQGILTAVLEGVQLVVLIVSIFPVEKALKREFDEQGRRREPEDMEKRKERE